ncbi:MAG TPA: TadE/TadG family type IV pilus assembly protein [Eoetvoesiella sp.]
MDLRTLFSVKKRAVSKQPIPGGRVRRRSFFRDQRGAVAPLFLVSTVAVLGTSLGGIDLVRYSVLQGKMQHALDGAALSAGRNLERQIPTAGTDAETAWKEDAFQYFRTNLPDGYLGSEIKPEDLTISYSDERNAAGGQYVNMDVKGILPLVSFGFLKLPLFEVKASNRAVRRTRSDLEVVMALDNTGSMTADDRIGTLKDAAKELTSIVLGAAAVSGAPHKVYIGLVPFADTVNVGSTVQTQKWVTEKAVPDGYLSKFWGGCIVEPPPSKWGGDNLPAQALLPTAGFQPLHVTLPTVLDRASDNHDGHNKDHGNNSDKVNNGNKKLDRNVLGDHMKDTVAVDPVPAGYPRIAPSTSNPRWYDEDVVEDSTSSYYTFDRRVRADILKSQTGFNIYAAFEPSNCKASRLTHFLSNDLTTINTAIDAMSAQGSTIIPTGLLWAWRMLSPSWRGMQGWGDPDMPRDPEPQKLTKVIVLLTDGENAPGSGSGPNSPLDFSYKLEYDVQVCPDANRGVTCDSKPLVRYEKLQPKFTVVERSSGSTNSPMNSLKMRDPTGEDGSSTIGWGSTSLGRASVNSYLDKVCENVKKDGNGIKLYTVTLGVDVDTAQMDKCSSGAGYFYNAANVDDLPNVFRSIAGDLTELRLTQ